MALNDSIFSANTAKGLMIGVGAAVVAPVAASALSGVGRPVARAAIKSGILFYDKGRETLAEVGEVFEDLVAEAQAELEEDREQRRSGAQGRGEESGEGQPPAPGEEQ